MNTEKHEVSYCPPRILSILISPDITKCMQNTGGIEDCSTFQAYKREAHKEVSHSQNGSEDKQIKFYEFEMRHFGNSTCRLMIMLLVFMVAARILASAALASEIPILIPQQHPVIQEIVDGINKGFEELGYKSKGFETVLMDGQGVPANFSTIIDSALQKRPPFIISITTGLSKTTVDKVLETVPVVFSGVTDPVGAKIVPDFVKHGKVTGASDLWPVEEQLRLIQRVLPKAKTVGVIFRPSEPNSQFGMRIAREAAKKLNLQLVEKGVEDSKDIVAVLDAILPQVDAIYIGPDNMTIESAKKIVESSVQAKKPVFGGEPGTLEKGAIGIVSINYFDLGRETAMLCDKILKGTPTEQIPVYVAGQGFVGLNYEAAARMNLSIPAEARKSATKTIGTYHEPVGASHQQKIMLFAVAALLICVVIWLVKRSRKTA